MRRSTAVRQLRALAKALRKGAKRREKSTGELFSTIDVTKNPDKPKYKLGASCALGAIYEGTFGKPPVRAVEGGFDFFIPKVDGGDEAMYARLKRKYPVLAQPVGLNSFNDVYEIKIISKNDTHDESREEIADWLEEQANELENDAGEEA